MIEVYSDIGKTLVAQPLYFSLFLSKRPMEIWGNART